MRLEDFKKHIEKYEDGKLFNFGISDPFSWRGCYSEVAFSIVFEPMKKEEILEKIEMCYKYDFIGWKGGVYSFYDNTIVNFEKSEGKYSEGNYCEGLIDVISDSDTNFYFSNEVTLINLIF